MPSRSAFGRKRCSELGKYSKSQTLRLPTFAQAGTSLKHRWAVENLLFAQGGLRFRQAYLSHAAQEPGRTISQARGQNLNPVKLTGLQVHDRAKACVECGSRPQSPHKVLNYRAHSDAQANTLDFTNKKVFCPPCVVQITVFAAAVMYRVFL